MQAILIAASLTTYDSELQRQAASPYYNDTMARSRKSSSRKGSENGDVPESTAAATEAQLAAVRRAMLADLGIGRVDSLRKYNAFFDMKANQLASCCYRPRFAENTNFSLALADRPTAADHSVNIPTVDPNSRWNLQDTSNNRPQAIANGQLYRIRREAQQSSSTESSLRSPASAQSRGMF